jgi:hypothetical protein
MLTKDAGVPRFTLFYLLSSDFASLVSP